MTHGSLFAGRGGFDIGAEAAGVKTAWTCETDNFLHHKLRINKMNPPPEVADTGRIFSTGCERRASVVIPDTERSTSPPGRILQNAHRLCGYEQSLILQYN